MSTLTKLIILSMTTTSIFAATSSTVSGLISTTPAQPMVLCYTEVINGVTLNSSPQTISMGTAYSLQEVSGGGLGFAGMTGGGALNPSCNSDYPYLHSFSEGWGGVIPFGIGAGMRAWCATTPQPPMSLNKTWVQGTHCN